MDSSCKMVSSGSQSLVDEMENRVETKDKPPSKDIRRYYCQYCGISRSKKNLLRSHILSTHKDAQSDLVEEVKKAECVVQHTCEECGASFRKLAHLKQHKQSHSAERPFSCPVDDCHASYRRKDHLTRHSLTHQGKLFTCPVDNCNRKFGFKANMKRHVNEIHEDEPRSEDEKQCACDEPDCGKTFKYPSRLKKHKDSHVKLDYVEVVCCDPSCMKTFTNAECLKAHIRSSHRYVDCMVCGTRQLKKNFRRHERMHETDGVIQRIKCDFKDCDCSFANESNLRQHIRVIHQNRRPFTCGFSGCGQKFSYRHVRDNHEKSGVHVYVRDDFLETDEQLRARPRGGRKRACPLVETLQRKRVVPPNQVSVLDDGVEYMRWLLSGSREQ